MSLSIVAGMPTTRRDMPASAACRERARAPRKVPSPPMATMPSNPSRRQVARALARPDSSINSKLRAVYRMVPPLLMMWLTLEAFICTKSLLIRPFQPRRMPTQPMPRLVAARTTARTAAFMPGASPPLVRTPIRLTCFSIR